MRFYLKVGSIVKESWAYPLWPQNIVHAKDEKTVWIIAKRLIKNEDLVWILKWIDPSYIYWLEWDKNKVS